MGHAGDRPGQGDLLVLLGTRDGLYRCRAGGAAPERHLGGLSINAVAADPRDGGLLVAANGPGGPAIWRSADGGATWAPLAGRPRFGDGRQAHQIWQVRPGHPSRPGELWAGTREAGLFRSPDLGATWRSVAGLNDHPTRTSWDEGGGGLILHTIIVAPGDPDRLVVGISAGGAYSSDDDGATWRPINSGVRPDTRPDHCAASGQCPHRLALHPARPGRLYQQGHAGVYRSDDYGEHWADISAGLPSPFGWPLALHPDDPDTLFVVPHISDKQRRTTEGRLAVWRSRDAGASWERLSRGLPLAPALCLRESLAADPAGDLYLGTADGRVFAGRDAGETWALFAEGLPPVQAVATAFAP
ncbi:MAG TPA: sialidase family protein [Chloroflexaceae bacterium]|nr:sialidase family protein [Chloroflexaceae bacterium]